jgi:hypothetical protein
VEVEKYGKSFKIIQYNKVTIAYMSLTNKEIYVLFKKPTITETIRLNRLRWFGYVQRMEENRIPKKVSDMNLETTRLRGRPRNRWQEEVREDGRLVGGRKGYITERNGRSS